MLPALKDQKQRFARGLWYQQMDLQEADRRRCLEEIAVMRKDVVASEKNMQRTSKQMEHKACRSGQQLALMRERKARCSN